GERDRRRRGDGADEQAAEQEVASAAWKPEPGRARAEVRDGEYAAAEVVRAEEAGRPTGPLRRGLRAGGRGEECEAGGPQRLLSRRPPAQRDEQGQRERQRDEGGGDGEERVRHRRRARVRPVADRRRRRRRRDDGQV